MNILEAVVLGAVEGITEFLPVSSTGHLTIVENLFGFDIEAKDVTAFTAQLKKAKINDMFAKDGYIRADGLMVHTMYVMQVKTPAESKYPWDYYKVIKVMTGEEADGTEPDQSCPMVKK